MPKAKCHMIYIYIYIAGTNTHLRTVSVFKVFQGRCTTSRLVVWILSWFQLACMTHHWHHVQWIYLLRHVTAHERTPAMKTGDAPPKKSSAASAEARLNACASLLWCHDGNMLGRHFLNGLMRKNVRAERDKSGSEVAKWTSQLPLFPLMNGYSTSKHGTCV